MTEMKLVKTDLEPLHTMWIGSRLGPSESLCLKSWVMHGHRVVLHAYGDLTVPAGVELVDAGKILPRDRIFKNRNGSLAPFSDVFRARLLQTAPVTWLDADIFLLRPFSLKGENILSREGDGAVNNAVMRLDPDHPILAEIVNRYKRPWTAIPWDKPRKAWPVLTMGATSFGLHARHLPWGALGAKAIDKQISTGGFDGTILGPECSLTAHRSPLFEALPNPDALLGEPVLYVHLYRSQIAGDLGNPVKGSVYARLWEMAA
jgi:hypothetical protein